LVDEIGKLRAELIFRNFGYPKKLLEIGAGFGGFLKSVSELSGGTVSYALEADSKCFIRISQYSTLIDSFEEMKNDKIEMVCAFHVLEHVLDPKQFVAEIADLLVEGGLVVFEVPDLLSNWMDWDSHIHGAHQSYFTSHSLQLLLRDHGMKPELIEQYGVGEILNGSILVVARKETEIGPQTESPKLVCNQVANIRRKLHAKKPSYLARLKARFRRLVKYIFGSEFIGKRQRKKFYANNSVLLK
jgi:SAM-dependent methyltransferase